MKLDIAQQLAKSVLYLHTTGLCTRTFAQKQFLSLIRGEAKSLFLVGFEDFREAKDDTFYTGDSLPEREMYRHPSRQGNNPERKYVMQHDIYSLGVRLLEIGMCKSFVKLEKNRLVIESDLDISERDGRKKAFATKNQLLFIAHERLSQHIGKRFKDTVEKCLTCLDEDTT